MHNINKNISYILILLLLSHVYIFIVLLPLYLSLSVRFITLYLLVLDTSNNNLLSLVKRCFILCNPLSPTQASFLEDNKKKTLNLF